VIPRAGLWAALAAALVVLSCAQLAFGSERHPTLAELETEVMCPTCHTTLDQSSAPVAERMKVFIRARIAAGDTKSEIKDKLVSEFGEQVLASPPKRGFNLLAWALPPIAVVAAGFVVGILAVRWSRRRGEVDDEVAPPPPPELDRRIDEELARFDA
jgi:cytochrome c-type biogenesis protein CcmH